MLPGRDGSRRSVSSPLGVVHGGGHHASPESSQLIPPPILPVVVEEVALASDTGVPPLILPVVEELVDDMPVAELLGEKTPAPEYRPRRVSSIHLSGERWGDGR